MHIMATSASPGSQGKPPLSTPRRGTRYATNKTVDWFGALNRFTASKRQAAQQQASQAQKRDQILRTEKGSISAIPATAADESDCVKANGRPLNAAPSILLNLSARGQEYESRHDATTEEKKEKKKRGTRRKARHLLVRGVDNSDWYPQLLEKIHGTRKIPLDPADYSERHKCFNTYKWFIRGPANCKDYNSVADLYVMRGRSGHTLLRKRDLTLALSCSSDNGLEHPTTIAASTSLPNLLMAPTSFYDLKHESRPAMDVEAIPIRTTVSANASRRTVNFSRIVHLAHASSPHEYERAGPDCFSEYLSLPREDRRSINEELDSFRWNEMIKKVHPSSAANMPRRRTLSMD